MLYRIVLYCMVQYSVGAEKGEKLRCEKLQSRYLSLGYSNIDHNRTPEQKHGEMYRDEEESSVLSNG